MIAGDSASPDTSRMVAPWRCNICAPRDHASLISGGHSWTENAAGIPMVMPDRAPPFWDDGTAVGYDEKVESLLEFPRCANASRAMAAQSVDRAKIPTVS